MLQAGQKLRLADGGPEIEVLSNLLDRGPVLLAFFKVSCPVCQYTFPFLDRISAGGTIPVVGIAQNGAEATEAFRSEYGLHFTLLLDPADDGYRISNAFRITHVPSVFLVEPDRQISHAFSGFSRSDLQAVGRRAGVEVPRQGEETPEFKPG